MPVGAVKDQKDARGRLRSASQTVNDEPSMTVQSDAHLADIREILRRFDQVGMNDMLDNADQAFMDVSEFTDFSDMMRQTAQATEEFMKLPARVRAAFDNDVYEWLDAAHDLEKRHAAMEKLGVAIAPEGAGADGEGVSAVTAAAGEGAGENGVVASAPDATS